KQQEIHRPTRVRGLPALASLALLGIASSGIAQTPDAAGAQGQVQRERLERVSAGLRHATAVRAARRIQAALSHYREAGLWPEAARLFTRDAVAHIAGQRHEGPAAIAAWLQAQALAGTGRSRLGEGDLNTHLVMSPVVTLDPDGGTARGRWPEVSMTGRHG